MSEELKTPAVDPEQANRLLASLQRDYTLTVPGVHGDFNRFVALATGYDHTKLTDAALAVKSTLLQQLALLGSFRRSVVVNIVTGAAGQVDVVLDAGRQDVYIKVRLGDQGFAPAPGATLLHGPSNASSVDMFTFEPQWFVNVVDKPAKLALVMHLDRVVKLLNDCWTEEESTERLVSQLAGEVASKRAAAEAIQKAKAAKEAQTAPARPVDEDLEISKADVLEAATVQTDG